MADKTSTRQRGAPDAESAEQRHDDAAASSGGWVAGLLLAKERMFATFDEVRKQIRGQAAQDVARSFAPAQQGEQTPQRDEPAAPPARTREEEIDALVGAHSGRLGTLKVNLLRAIVRWADKADIRKIADPSWDRIREEFGALGGDVESTDSTDGYRLTWTENGQEHSCDNKSLRFSRTMLPKANAIFEALNSSE